jgi:hypothetical protein
VRPRLRRARLAQGGHHGLRLHGHCSQLGAWAPRLLCEALAVTPQAGQHLLILRVAGPKLLHLGSVCGCRLLSLLHPLLQGPHSLLVGLGLLLQLQLQLLQPVLQLLLGLLLLLLLLLLRTCGTLLPSAATLHRALLVLSATTSPPP